MPTALPVLLIYKVYCTDEYRTVSVSVPDPDPLVRSTDPDPSIIEQSLLCDHIPLLLSFATLFPVLCSSISCPRSLVFHTCENSSFSLKFTCIHLTAGSELVLYLYVRLVAKLREWLDAHIKELREVGNEMASPSCK
jgi:hypothetical protein